MTTLLSTVTDPLQYGFMRLGLIEVMLLGIASGLVGVFVVQRQLTFFAHALPHTIFPAVVLAAVLRVDLAAGALVGAALTLVLVFGLQRHAAVGHSGAVGIVLITFLALGVVFVGLFRVRTADVGAALVGNVLGTSAGDVLLTAALVAGIAVTLWLVFWPLVFTSFDTRGAAGLGLPVILIEVLLLVMVAGTAVVGVRVTGIILTTAELVVPAAAALRWTRRLRPAMALAAGISAASGLAGLMVAYYVPVAPAAVIVLILAGFFVASIAFGTDGPLRRS
ncbi:MAG: hypothetical protein GEU73_12900 [Chloroflexi bacterium]|nr:hypothetical protein [Chloroflexota bacterium]